MYQGFEKYFIDLIVEISELIFFIFFQNKYNSYHHFPNKIQILLLLYV